MALIDPSTSGSAISQGQGQGYAQILGQSSFDPVSFVQNVAARQEARRMQELDDELKMREKNAKARVVSPEVGLYNEDEVYKAVEDYNKELAKFQAMGIDIEGSPEGRAILNKGNAEIKGLTEADKVVQERIKHFENLAQQNPGKFDFEELGAWKQQIADVSGVKNKARFALEHSPFKAPDFDMNKPVLDLAKSIGEETIETGGETVTQWPEEKVTRRVQDFLVGMPQNELQQYFETGKKKGRWNDFPGMQAAVIEEVKGLGPYKKTLDEPKAAGGGGISFNVGGGVETDKWRATPAFNENFAYGTKGENNVITLNPTSGAEMKPFELYDSNGKPIYTKVASIRKSGSVSGTNTELVEKVKAKEKEIRDIAAGTDMGKLSPDQKKKVATLEKELNELRKQSSQKQVEKGGQRSGNWIIEGTKAKRITGEQATKAKEADPANFLSKWAPVEGEDNTYISITENEPVQIPISSVRGEKGYDNYQRIYGMTGIELAPMMNGSGNTKTDSGVIDLDL